MSGNRTNLHWNSWKFFDESGGIPPSHSPPPLCLWPRWAQRVHREPCCSFSGFFFTTHWHHWEMLQRVGRMCSLGKFGWIFERYSFAGRGVRVDLGLGSVGSSLMGCGGHIIVPGTPAWWYSLEQLLVLGKPSVPCRLCVYRCMCSVCKQSSFSSHCFSHSTVA